jgi:CRISPR/Cas system-associated endoribonuclease Cas2
MLKAVLKDSKIQNLLIDFCTSAEDEKLKKEPYLKGLYDRVMDKINPLRPKALVDYPSNLIAGLIVSIIVLSIVYLYNTFTSGELDVRHVDRFKGIDLETLNAPPELKKLIEDNQNINQQITDFQTAVNGMNVYQEYLKELNPVTGHTDWIEKGLDYYNNPENTRYLEKIDSHIKNEDSYFHKIKSMIDLGNLSTDTGKATRGLLAENMRLKALAEKNQNDCEGYDIGLRNSHLQLKKEVMEKLNNKKDSNFINEAQAEELQKKLDKCKDIDNDSFLVIFVKNRKLEKINRDLDKNIYDESAPEGGSLCTIF